jgi:hypothetical protein
VYASTNLLELSTSPSNLGTLNLGPTGSGSFTDIFVTNITSKFYCLSTNGCCSAVIGYAMFTLDPGTNFIADPFIDVSDGDYGNPNNTNSNPVNTVGTLFRQGCTTQPLPENTIVTGFTSQGFLSETNLGNIWVPDGVVSINPSAGVIVSNGSTSSTLQWVVGVVRPSVTNQIPAGKSYLASGLPESGGITSVLGLSGLSSGDMLSLWNNATSSFVTYTNTGSGWTPSEPTVGLCEGFILNCAVAHTWTQSQSPCH